MNSVIKYLFSEVTEEERYEAWEFLGKAMIVSFVVEVLVVIL